MLKEKILYYQCFFIALSNGDFSCGVRARNRTSTTGATSALPTGKFFNCSFYLFVFDYLLSISSLN